MATGEVPQHKNPIRPQSSNLIAGVDEEEIGNDEQIVGEEEEASVKSDEKERDHDSDDPREQVQDVPEAHEEMRRPRVKRRPNMPTKAEIEEHFPFILSTDHGVRTVLPERVLAIATLCAMQKSHWE